MKNTNDSTPTAGTLGSPFVGGLIGRWYECAPYGDQIPRELPGLLSQFCAKHGQLDEDGMFAAFAEAQPDDPILQLFESIFAEAAQFTLNRLSDAVYDRDKDVLAQIGLVPLGTLATQMNDPNPRCEHQHIIHPDQGGRMLFAEKNTTLSGQAGE